MPRVIFFLQTADCGDANDPSNVEGSQRPEIGTMIDFCRQKSVATTMARQEPDLTTRHFAADESIARRAEWRIDPQFFRLGEAVHFIETTAADDANRRCLMHAAKMELTRAFARKKRKHLLGDAA
jgi:hypothetical protein